MLVSSSRRWFPCPRQSKLMTVFSAFNYSANTANDIAVCPAPCMHKKMCPCVPAVYIGTVSLIISVESQKSFQGRGSYCYRSLDSPDGAPPPIPRSMFDEGGGLLAGIAKLLCPLPPEFLVADTAFPTGMRPSGIGMLLPVPPLLA